MLNKPSRNSTENSQFRLAPKPLQPQPLTADFQNCSFICPSSSFICPSSLAEAVHEKRRSIEQVAITTQWYVDSMPKLRAAFESRQIAIPADSDSIDDLMQVRLHNGIPKLVSGRRRTDSGARHGDFAIAVALAYSASFDDYLGRFDELMAEFASDATGVNCG